MKSTGGDPTLSLVAHRKEKKERKNVCLFKLKLFDITMSIYI